MAEYIERSAAIRALTLHDCDSADAKIVIRDIPAADVAPVMHGRWSWDTGDIWTCSVCGTRNHIKEVMGRPDCGAHMNKEATDGN